MIGALRLERTHLSKPPGAGSLSAALLFALLLSALFAASNQGWLGLPESLSATHAQVFGRHEYWRAFTSAWLHADFKHLGGNLALFLVLSYLLNGYFGRRVFPALALAAGGLINLVTLAAYPPDAGVIGISGVVYFMASFWVTMYFLIERGMSPWRRFLNAGAFVLVLLFPETFEAHVSYLAHAVGFGLGVPAALAFFALDRRRMRSSEVWREIPPDPLAGVEEGYWNRPREYVLELASDGKWEMVRIAEPELSVATAAPSARPAV